MASDMTAEQINDMAFISVMETNDTLMEGIATLKDQRDELRALCKDLITWADHGEACPMAVYESQCTCGWETVEARARAVLEPQEAPDAK